MLRPQDIVTLVYLAINRDKQFQQKEIAQALSLSPAEISMSLRRSQESGLYESGSRKVNVANLMELLVHSIKYFFPALPKGIDRGVPTGWGVMSLRRQIAPGSDTVPVWPHPDGTESGLAITPLADIVPGAALKDPEFHEAMALVDAFRIGKARERELAKTELEKRFGSHAVSRK